MDGDVGGGAGDVNDGLREGRRTEADMGIVGEAEAFFGDADQIAVEAGVGVLVVDGGDGIVARRQIRPDGNGGAGVLVDRGRTVAEAFSLSSGQPSGERKRMVPRLPRVLRKPST
jgi:hypothetical protein